MALKENRQPDISDLKDVIYAMKQSKFPDHRWSPLGLQLGLLQPTLSHIRVEYKDDPESCLRECLTLWLNKADEVTESGGSTWDSLADALHKIGEDFAAETIRAFSKKFNDENVRTSHLLFPKPQLDISDLKDVIYAMKQSKFPNHHWSPLGLQLGLLQPTLSHIRVKYKDDPESCLQECLTLWLNKADEVTESGGSTWDSLADALHKIEEDFAAETIRAFSKKFNDENVRTSHLLFPKPQLGISDLKDVIYAMKQSKFPNHRWSLLGLQLGLLQPTLSHIRVEYKDDPESCLQECLTLWLNKADKVTESGGSTWDSLSDALHKIGETFATMNIRTFSKKFNDGDVRTSHLLFPKPQLDISDLKDVIYAMKQSKFPDHRWSPLGLQLGLLQPTLSHIRVEYKDDPESCLRECLTLWLNKADEVTESGGSTWDSLADALHKIGEDFAAETIRAFSKKFNDEDVRTSHLLFLQRQLDISDLKDVIYAMKISKFPNHRWSPIGLQLGLLQPTLSHIRVEYKDDPESCLQECLTLWLNKADEVTESGGSTWDSLADALHKIGEDFAAETIRAFSKKFNDEDVRTSHLLFPKPQLGISDLKDVIYAMKISKFPSHRWSPLGLQLGLLQPTLSHIRVEYKDDPESCLQECLALWLNKADKVTESGGSTWDSLVDALHKIGETFATMNIRTFSKKFNDKNVRTSHLLFPKPQLASEKELLSVSDERQGELETLQEIITTLRLQLRERDKQIEELKQSLKGFEEQDALKMNIPEMSSVKASKETENKQSFGASAKMNRAMILQIEQLKRREVELLSDKEKLQTENTSLTLQLKESNQQIEEPDTQETLEMSEETELTTIKRMNKTTFSQLDKLTNILKGKESLEDEQDTLKKKTSDDGIENKTVTTSFTLQLSERDKLNELQQSFLLKALDLAVISKAQNLLPIKGLNEMQTMAKEKESTLSNSEKKELKDQLEDDRDHDISLSSPSKFTEESVDQQNTEHDTLTLQLRERDKQIGELKQSLKEMRQMKLEDLASYLNQMEGNLRGVIPAGDTLFLLRGSSQPQFFNWEKYGLSLSAPEGILPPSETCEVVITALAGGEFEFPKGCELVSAVYAIFISNPLLKPLTVNIQHCVALETPEQCNSLQFMKAPVNNGIPPYQFEVLPGGHFSPGNQYGSISCTEFSLFGLYLHLEDIEDNAGEGEDSTSDDNSHENEETHISEENDLQPSNYDEFEIKERDETCDDMEVQAVEIKAENLEDDEVRHKLLQNSDTTVSTSHNAATKLTENILYYCKVYYEEKATLEYEWKIMFTVVKHLDVLQQYIKRCHPHAEEAQKIGLVLKPQNDIEFDIQKYRHEIPQGWVILPRMQPLVVKYTDIKMFGSTGHHEPPLCLVDICADLGPDTVKRLHYKVPVLGVEWNVDLFINLFLRQKSVQLTTTHHSDQVMNHGAQVSVPEHQSPMEDVLINKQSTDMMGMNSRKRPRGDEEISEEESKQKRKKHDWSHSMNSLAIITGDNLKEIKRIIQDVLTNQYSALDDLLKVALKSVARDMYSHGLISETTKDTPTFDDIMREFKSSMNFIHTSQKLVKRCQLFLQSLAKQEGPYKDAASFIAEEWTANIEKQLDINIKFDIE